MTTYLEETFLPFILTIEPKRTQSYILEALGLDDRVSEQSILIAFGERVERFWNKVISDSLVAQNLIEDTNLIKINGKNRQIDHLFRLLCEHWYFESKCNLSFDSEKIVASNAKIKDISLAIGGDVKSGYFVPVVAEPSKKDKKKYEKKGVDVYGVNWMIDKIQPPFTSEEYFTFLREVVAPILVKKGL